MSSLDDLLRKSGVVVSHGEPAVGDRRRVFLHAGQVCTAAEPTEITTILGSCVAICIWDPVSGIGGMNHFMLPRDIGTDFGTPRYATYATNLLLDQLQAAGADLRRAKAKIFGGARILGAGTDTEHDLGTQNVHVARERLLAERIPIVEEQTGGSHGRKLIYQSSTGQTTVTRVTRGAR